MLIIKRVPKSKTGIFYNKRKIIITHFCKTIFFFCISRNSRANITFQLSAHKPNCAAFHQLSPCCTQKSRSSSFQTLVTFALFINQIHIHIFLFILFLIISFFFLLKSKIQLVHTDPNSVNPSQQEYEIQTWSNQMCNWKYDWHLILMINYWQNGCIR